MLKKENRLTRSKEIQNVFTNGRTFKMKDFLIKNLETNNEHTRFNFIISKKISKKAVTRNKIKRQLREIIREVIDEIKPSYDIIIVTKPSILSSKAQNVKDDIYFALKKIKLLNS